MIPPGQFIMGGDGKNVVDVRLSKPFRFGIHEVTQGQWKAAMGSEPWTNEESNPKGENFPAMSAKWSEVTEFCRHLTGRERAAGKLPADWEYRLPTAAEWEFSCRAGTTSKYSFGGDESLLDDYAWYDSNTKEAGELYAHPVGLKRPNRWGLYDMHGNVSEWCSDWYTEDVEEGGVDPHGPSEGTERLHRGGSWSYPAAHARSPSRWRFDPSSRNHTVGFRVALSLITEPGH